MNFQTLTNLSDIVNVISDITHNDTLTKALIDETLQLISNHDESEITLSALNIPTVNRTIVYFMAEYKNGYNNYKSVSIDFSLDNIRLKDETENVLISSGAYAEEIESILSLTDQVINIALLEHYLNQTIDSCDDCADIYIELE